MKIFVKLDIFFRYLHYLVDNKQEETLVLHETEHDQSPNERNDRENKSDKEHTEPAAQGANKYASLKDTRDQIRKISSGCRAVTTRGNRRPRSCSGGPC